MKVVMLPDYTEGNPYQKLLSKYLQQQGVDVIIPSGYRHVLPIFRLANPERPDIIHLHWPDPYFKGSNLFSKFLLGTKLLLDVGMCRFFGYRIVWTIHNLVRHDSKYYHVELFIYHLLSKLTHALIAHGKLAKVMISNAYRVNMNKIKVIPHGHYKEVYGTLMNKEVACKMLDMPHDKKIFLSFGMVKPYKGLEDLINLWRTEDLGALLIAGKAQDEEYGKSIEQLIKDCPNIHFHNAFIEEEKVSVYFSAADVVVMAFKNILTSGSVLLALSFGKLTIAPRTGGIADLFPPDYPFLYNSSEEFLSHLKRVSEQDTVPGISFSESELEQLSWGSIASQTKQLYEQVTA